MVEIIGHLSVSELEARYRVAREAGEARRVQAIWLLARGKAALDVAGVLALTPRWVRALARRYNTHGPEVLEDRRQDNGRCASILTEAVLSALTDRVGTPPEDGGLWSGPKAARWIAGHLGLRKVHPQRGWEALKRVGLTIQTPRPRHPRAATEEERGTLKKSSTRRWPRPARPIPADRSRSGPRTNPGSA